MMSSSATILERLEQRAILAEQFIEQLQQQIAPLRTAAACRAEEKQLTEENKKLRQAVLEMKAKLTRAEVQNGMTVQVPLPNSTDTQTPIAAPSNQAPIALPSDQKPATTSEATTKSNKNNEKQEKKGEAKKPKKLTPVAAPVDASRLDMRVGHIVNIKKHPGADGLYVEEVDLGEGSCRTIVSGLVNHVPIEKMHGRLAIFLINLKPAKVRDILSQGMIMCASSPELVEIIDPPEGAAIGDRVTIEGYDGTPDVQLNPKKKVWQEIQPDLHVNGDGMATYKGASWLIEGKGVCRSPTARNQGIK